MKKAILGLVVLAVLASCGGSKTEAVSTDSTAVKVDSTKAVADSTVKADTTVTLKK